jgi:UDPglucose 6-dehydrogenase
MDNVAIVGMGVLGSALQKAFDIPVYFDIDSDKSNANLKDVSKQQLVFLCLPTPTEYNGKQTNMHIEMMVQQIAEYGNRNFFVNRSTCIPGTTRRIKNTVGVQVIHNPEFLSEDTALEDTLHPDFVAIGSDPDCEPARIALMNFYKRVGLGEKLHYMDSVTSETLKYAMNMFFALKVAYGNTLFDICQLNGAKYDKVRDCMYQSKYVAPNHLDVFHKGYRGFGGHCLPKDLQAFNAYLPTKLLELVEYMNKEQKWM